MKRYITTVIFALIYATSFGQIKTCEIPTFRQVDTTLWYKWKHADAAKMGLPDLTKSTDSLHFRFWTETQAIDIWTSDYKTFKGLLSNHTYSYDSKNEDSSKFYSNKINIDTATARKIHKLFADNLIFQIPTDEKISGWVQGNDGEEFLIEYSTKTIYSFKEYWTPSLFKKLKEAITIDNLSKELVTILNLNKYWDTFINGLPKGCYRSGELTMTCNNKK